MKRWSEPKNVFFWFTRYHLNYLFWLELSFLMKLFLHFFSRIPRLPQGTLIYCLWLIASRKTKKYLCEWRTFLQKTSLLVALSSLHTNNCPNWNWIFFSQISYCWVIFPRMIRNLITILKMIDLQFHFTPHSYFYYFYKRTPGKLAPGWSALYQLTKSLLALPTGWCWLLNQNTQHHI